MFAKLKKKVEDLEGSDLHKLANSISFSNSGGPEKSVSSNSIKSSPDNFAAPQSLKGSTTSISSIQGLGRTEEAEANQAAEKKWKQRLVEIENEWRVKVMVQEHEKELVTKDRDVLVQQKRKMEEEVRELRGMHLISHYFFSLCKFFFLWSGYQERWLKAEENLKHLQESKNRESASFQLLVTFILKPKIYSRNYISGFSYQMPVLKWKT